MFQDFEHNLSFLTGDGRNKGQASRLTARAVSNAIVQVCRGRVTKGSSILDCKVEDAAAEVTQRA